MNGRWIRIGGIIFSAMIGLMIMQHPSIDAFILNVQKGEDQSALLLEDPKEALLEKIKEEAPQKEQAPIDARIDRVWKAIPGYNGRKVDIESTYRETLKKPNQEIQWRYREVPPKIQLQELGAAPIYRGNEKKQAVSLMVNVAWGTEYLPKMLDIFDQEKIKVTFFLDGSWLKKNPEIAKELVKRGHEIGNHAYSHPLMSQISTGRIQEEIGKTQQLIEDTLQVKSRWFAPPAGDYNQHVVDIAWEKGMHTVLWTVDTVDWKKSSTPNLMVQRVSKRISPGSLVLMHPTDRTVVALPQIIQDIKKKDLQLVPVGELLSSSRIDID